MQLEDHLGDILSKARAMRSVSIDTAASAAGLSTNALASLEQSGCLETKTNLDALAALLGLNGPRLRGLAQGWQPAPKDLSFWRELRQITTTAEGITVHCYLIWDEISREAALFDTGWNAEPVLSAIAEHQLQLRHIFLTHLHQDHLEALGAIRGKIPKVRLHSSSKNAPVDQRNRANDFIHLGNLRITHRPTPGHTEEGTTYIIGNWPEDAPHVAIVGDALFAGSIGRADGLGEIAQNAIRERIFSLPAETLICPGHGPLTTVGEEKAHNPFFG